MRFQRLLPDHLPLQVSMFSPQRVFPSRSDIDDDDLTDRQGLLSGSDRRVLGVRYEASPRARCHRNPHPRGTVARENCGWVRDSVKDST